MTIHRLDNSKIVHDVAHAKIEAGQVVCSHPRQNWRLVPASAKEEVYAKARGIAIDSGDELEDVRVVYRGLVEFDKPILTPGYLYCLSPKKEGELVPFTELEPGDFVCLIGMAQTQRVLNVDVRFDNVRLGEYAPPKASSPKPKSSKGKSDLESDDTLILEK